MQQVATCPACDAHLALPKPALTADGSLTVACPRCSDRFPLTIDRLTFLPVARLEPAGTPTADRPISPSPSDAQDRAASAAPSAVSAADDGQSEATPPAPEVSAPSPATPAISTPAPSEAVSEEPSQEANEAPDNKRREALPTLADLLERRPSVADEPSPLTGDTTDSLSSDRPADQPTGSFSNPIESGDESFTMVDSAIDDETPLRLGDDPPAEDTEDPLDLEFRFDPEPGEPDDPPSTLTLHDNPAIESPVIENRVAEAPVVENSIFENREPAKPMRSGLKRAAVVAAGGLSGVALGLYLLSVMSGDGFKTAARADREPAVASEPAPLDAGAAEAGRPLAPSETPLARPEKDGARQASYTAPAAEKPRPAGGDRLWAWLNDAPRFGVDDLKPALDGVGPAVESLRSHRLDDASQLQEVGLGYAKLCELAQIVSLLDNDDTHPDMMMQRLEAEDVYRKLFRSGHVRGDSRKIAARWIAWPGRPHGGVFFAGVPDGPGRRVGGGLFQYVFTFEDGAETRVVSPKRFDGRRFEESDEMLVIGCVIDAPSEHLRGYEGDAERVVWRATSIALSDSDLP